MIKPIIFILMALALVTACSKDNANNEQLYGTWTKGNRVGDTIIFMNDSGRHIIQFPVSNVAGLPGYSRLTYRYQQNKLYISMPGGSEYTCNSFNWKVKDKSFELQGNDLYWYMSSIAPRYVYTKVD